MVFILEPHNGLPITYFFTPLEGMPKVKDPEHPRDKDGFIMLVATQDRSYYQIKKKNKRKKTK